MTLTQKAKIQISRIIFILSRCIITFFKICHKEEDIYVLFWLFLGRPFADNTMNKTLLYVLLFIISFPLSICADEREKLLNKLDKIIENRYIYMEMKEARIDSLKKLLYSSDDTEKQYKLNNKISAEYSTYRYDSAIYYVSKSRLIADELNIQKYKDETTLYTITLLATTGMIKESIDMLNSIERAQLDSSLFLNYYLAGEWVYYAARNFANDNIFAPQYKKTERAYLDSIYETLYPNTIMKEYHKGYILLRDGNLDEAQTILSSVLNKLTNDNRQYAITANNLATINLQQGNLDRYEEYLIKAVISDQICALKENVAMQNLAIYLFKHKPDDLERAYKYIQCAMEDAQFYNSRFRMVQVSRNLPIIVSAYNSKNESKNRILKLSLVTISLLFALMVILIFNIYRQMNLLRKSRKKLFALNAELKNLNNQLSEANKTKEEYVGLFMDLCSSYIDKLGQYMEIVKRKIIVKQIDDLYKLSNSPKTIQKELEEFLLNFDNAFLNLYPTFVEDFNKLLSDEGKIILKKDEKMNTELRIFALIRLGISDSSKIAAFLHYSPQTIYNYRTRVKNYANVDRNDFEKNIKGIGSFENKEQG